MENQPPRPRLRPDTSSQPDFAIIIARAIVQEIQRYQRKGIYNLGTVNLSPGATRAIAQSRDAQQLLSEWGYEFVHRI